MNILVVGRGWTGRKVFDELLARGHTVTFTNHDDAFDAVKYGRHDWVVNCAGVTGSPNVDACEKDRAGTIEANAIFPIKLYDLCDSFGIQFAHFSSGCIYQGDITDDYADPNYFGSIYSVAKGVSDLYLRDRNALIFRIRMPFTGVNEKKNYLTKVIKYATTAKLIDAGQNSLTDLDEAVKVACDMIEAGESGPANLVNQGSVNMHELVEILGLADVQWFTPEEFKAATVASRSTCTIPAHPAMRPIRDALRDAAAKMKQ